MVAALALAATLATAASAQRAERLRIPFPREDGSLTPYTFELGYPLVTLVYDTLMWRDARGVPRPWLARSVERDGLTLTVRLRRGVRWQDGAPLTAADVAFTFQFVAAHPHPRFSPQLRDVAGVELTGPDTVVIRLRRPDLGFLDQPLADLPILPEHLWSRLPAGRLAPPGPPVGSGPYRLVRHRRGKEYVFRANERYFRGRPRVREIDVPIIRRPDKTVEALRERRVDALPFGVTPDTSEEAQGLGIVTRPGASYSGTVLMFNVRRPPFDDPRARRAVARALDLTRIARNLGPIPATLPAAPAERGYLHPLSRWAPNRDLHEFAPGRARIAFSELGLPRLRVFAANNDPLRAEAGRQVVLALRRAGAQATLRELPPRRLARAVGQDAFGASFDLAIWSTPPLASYDPGFLRAVFGPPGEAPLNYSGYASARFDRLADRVDAAATVRARRRAVAAELTRLARDLPVVPLFYANDLYGIRSEVYDGWVVVRGTGILDKRSFLPGARERGAGPAPLRDPRDRLPSDDGGGFPVFAIAGLALLAGALLWRVAAWRRA